MPKVVFSKDPVPPEILYYIKDNWDDPAEQEAEVEAFKKICDRFAKEKNYRKKVAMQNMLGHILSNRYGMKPSYAFTEGLDSSLSYEKDAEKEMYPIPLYEIVTDAVTHATMTVGRGRSTRWTVYAGGGYYSDADGLDRKRYDEWLPTEIRGAYVKFGSHRFTIGGTADQILKALEERYGLDFKAMEKARSKQ